MVSKDEPNPLCEKKANEVHGGGRGEGAFQNLEESYVRRQIPRASRLSPLPSSPIREFSRRDFVGNNFALLEMTKGQLFAVTKAHEIDARVFEVQVRGKGTRALRKHPPAVLSIMQNICFLPGSHWRFPRIILPFILERQAVRNCSLLRVCECVRVYIVK